MHKNGRAMPVFRAPKNRFLQYIFNQIYRLADTRAGRRRHEETICSGMAGDTDDGIVYDRLREQRESGGSRRSGSIN